jgi:predicted  nucleic acid-binding Zn-ribbon protein
MDTSSEYQFNGYDSHNQDTESSYHERSSEETEIETFIEDEEEYEQEEEDEEEEETKSRGYGKIFAIVILSLLLIASLVGNYYFFDENATLTSLKEQEKKQLDTIIVAKEQVEKQLNESKVMIESYKAESANAQSSLDAANAEIDKKKRIINKMYKEKASLSAFKSQLAEAKSFNETLQTQIKALADELTLVKAENSALKDSLVALRADRKTLNDKIISASGLQAHTIKMESLSQKKKEKYEFTDRAKRTNRIAISFELAENKLAAAGVHNLHILIYSPTGEILGDTTKTFTIQPEGKQSPYTRNKEVNYPSEGGKIFFNWDETPKYTKGQYRTEVYTDGKLTGQTEIELK